MATSSTAKTKSDDKAQIKQLIDDFNNALMKKDINRMLSPYAADAVMFDAKPPFQTRGAVAWRHTWEACIGYFPDSFGVEIKDLSIFAGSDLAFAHWLFKLVIDGPHDAGQTWIRATACYKKIQGKWKIVHEHGSVPFNPHTLQAMFSLEV